MKQMNLCGMTSLKVISGALQSLKKDAKNIYIFQGLTKHCEIMSCTVWWDDVCLSGEIKLPAEYTQEDLSLDTDLQVLLPQRRGLGLCSTALISYLITLHNDLVYAVEKHTGEESG